LNKRERLVLQVGKTPHLTSRELAEILGYDTQDKVHHALLTLMGEGVLERTPGHARNVYGGAPYEWTLTTKGEDWFKLLHKHYPKHQLA